MARCLGVMESVETDEHGEKDDIEVDKDGLQTSEFREPQEPETQIVQNKHTDRSEVSAATNEKDASKDNANKKTSKATARWHG